MNDQWYEEWQYAREWIENHEDYESTCNVVNTYYEDWMP